MPPGERRAEPAPSPPAVTPSVPVAGSGSVRSLSNLLPGVPTQNPGHCRHTGLRGQPTAQAPEEPGPSGRPPAEGRLSSWVGGQVEPQVKLSISMWETSQCEKTEGSHPVVLSRWAVGSFKSMTVLGDRITKAGLRLSKAYITSVIKCFQSTHRGNLCPKTMTRAL